MPLVNYIVNASTSVIQIPTVLLSTTQSTPIVLLSSLNSPGQIITVRDTDGICSLDFPIVISTTANVNYLEGPQVSTLRITQPFGFAAVSPRTSTIWNILNTYAFPEQYAAANLNTLNTSIVYTSSMIATGEIVMSSVTVSSLNVTTFVTSASTSVNAMVVKSTLNVGDTISTGGNVFIGGELSTLSSLHVGDDAFMARSLYVESTISTTYVAASYDVQTQYVQAWGSSFGAYNNFLANIAVYGVASFMSSCYIDFVQVCSMNAYDTVSTLAHVQMTSTLTVLGKTLLQNVVSTTGNVSIGGNLSTAGTLSVTGNTALGANLSTAGTLSVTGGAVLGANLSTASNAFFGGSISTSGSLSVTQSGYFGDSVITSTLSTVGPIYVGGLPNEVSIFSTAIYVTGVESYITELNSDYLTASSFTVQGSAQFNAAVNVQSTLTAYGLATFESLLNASTISTTGNIIVGASLSASSFNTTNITASTFTITSNATVQSTLTANIVAVGPSTVRLNLSTATQGCAITWNRFTTITGGSAYTELIGSKGTVGGVGGFAFYTQVPNDTVPALSNLALQITDRGNNTQTLIVNGGATFSSTITTQTLNASGRVRADAISTNTISTGTLTAGPGTVRLNQGTPANGLAITWNSYPALTGNGNVELLAGKGGAATGGFAFYTGLANDATPSLGNLSMYISQPNITNTLQVYGGIQVVGGGTFSNTVTFSNAFSVTGGQAIFTGTNTPRMTYGLQIDQAAAALSVSTLTNFNSTVTFGVGGTVNIMNGLYLANSATQQLACATQATFTNNVTFSNSSAITFNFGSNSIVNFSNATVQGLSISFPVTNL